MYAPFTLLHFGNRFNRVEVMYNKTITDLRKLDTIIPAEAASIATSIWPITRRDHGRGRKKLNRLQREAIQIACNNKFTIIQGPPGLQQYSPSQCYDYST